MRNTNSFIATLGLVTIVLFCTTMVLCFQFNKNNKFKDNWKLQFDRSKIIVNGALKGEALQFSFIEKDSTNSSLKGLTIFPDKLSLKNNIFFNTIGERDSLMLNLTAIANERYFHLFVTPFNVLNSQIFLNINIHSSYRYVFDEKQERFYNDDNEIVIIGKDLIINKLSDSNILIKCNSEIEIIGGDRNISSTQIKDRQSEFIKTSSLLKNNHENGQYPSINWLGTDNDSIFPLVLYITDKQNIKLINPNYFYYYLNMDSSLNQNQEEFILNMLKNLNSSYDLLIPLSSSLAIKRYNQNHSKQFLEEIYPELEAMNIKWQKLLKDFRANKTDHIEGSENTIFGLPEIFYTNLMAYDSNMLMEISTILGKNEEANKYRNLTLLQNVYLNELENKQNGNDIYQLLSKYSRKLTSEENSADLHNINIKLSHIEGCSNSIHSIEKEYDLITIQLIRTFINARNIAYNNWLERTANSNNDKS